MASIAHGQHETASANGTQTRTGVGFGHSERGLLEPLPVKGEDFKIPGNVPRRGSKFHLDQKGQPQHQLRQSGEKGQSVRLSVPDPFLAHTKQGFSSTHGDQLFEDAAGEEALNYLLSSDEFTDSSSSSTPRSFSLPETRGHINAR